jgi:hypothetical protein
VILESWRWDEDNEKKILLSFKVQLKGEYEDLLLVQGK